MGMMEPFFFGTPSRFAIYHPAAVSAPAAATSAALLLYPLGHEYIRAHRAFRNLALALSRAGVPVLRFDYGGTGDSAGRGDDVRLEGLQQDADAALDELSRRANVERVWLIGLRFGAALAAMAASRHEQVASVVLWDPVLSGVAYLEELRRLQVAWLHDRLGAGTESLAGENELLGMPAGAEWRRGIEAVDLTRQPLPGRAAVHLLTSADRPDCAEWATALQRGGITAQWRQVPTAGGWLNPEAVHQLLLPHEMITTIVALVRA